MRTWTLPEWLFAASCGLLVYVIVIYPLLLTVLARFWPRPVKKNDEYLPTVTILITAHNAGDLMHRALESALRLEYPRELVDILVISDGSTDNTDDIVREYAAWDVGLLHAPLGGRAAAINSGMPWVRTAIVVLTDVRQVLEPQSVREMVKCFADPEVGVVSGEVIFQAAEDTGDERVFAWHQEMRSWRQEQLGALDSMLEASGRFYGIRRLLMPELPTHLVHEDSHAVLSAFFRGYRVVPEPGARAWEDARLFKTTFRQKLLATAGEYEILQEHSGLLTARNRMRFHSWSHIVGHLLVPIALIVLAETSFKLPSKRAMISALAVQMTLYGLALFDQWIPEDSFVKRWSAAARLFVETAIASLCALPALFMPGRRLFGRKG